MKIITNILFCVLILSSTVMMAQKKKGLKKDYVFGVQFKPIVPINYFGAGPVDIKDTIVNINVAPKLGFNFGMVMRRDFSDFFSLETGINYTRRNFDISSYESARDTNDLADFGLVAYQIPIQGLVYIRLSENLYMNTSAGIGVDMYPSHVQSNGVNDLIQHLSLRTYWMHFSMLANIGFELRTEEHGRFYIGGSFSNPFKTITDTRIRYYHGNTSSELYSTELRGTYITVDLRYFFRSYDDEKKKLLNQ